MTEDKLNFMIILSCDSLEKNVLTRAGFDLACMIELSTTDCWTSWHIEPAGNRNLSYFTRKSFSRWFNVNRYGLAVFFLLRIIPPALCLGNMKRTFHNNPPLSQQKRVDSWLEWDLYSLLCGEWSPPYHISLTPAHTHKSRESLCHLTPLQPIIFEVFTVNPLRMRFCMMSSLKIERNVPRTWCHDVSKRQVSVAWSLVGGGICCHDVSSRHVSAAWALVDGSVCCQHWQNYCSSFGLDAGADLGF